METRASKYDVTSKKKKSTLVISVLLFLEYQMYPILLIKIKDCSISNVTIFLLFPSTPWMGPWLIKVVQYVPYLCTVGQRKKSSNR